MSFSLSTRPVSQHLGGPSASTPLPGFDNRPQPRPAVRSHYRPHSTLCLEEPAQSAAPNLRNSVLSRARRHSLIRRSVSLGETMGLGKKKATEQDSKCKDKPQLTRMRNLTDIATPTPTMSRPNTSAGGSSLSERSSSSNGRGSALHRVKAQRSIGSLFAAAGADVSPNSVSPTSEQIARPRLSPSPSPLPPPTLRTRKMNAAASTRPRAVSAPRPKRHSRQDYENEMNAKKKTDTNNWVTRSRTRVHPYAKEVPYMQAYDIPCLEKCALGFYLVVCALRLSQRPVHATFARAIKPWVTELPRIRQEVPVNRLGSRLWAGRMVSVRCVNMEERSHRRLRPHGRDPSRL